MQLSIKAVKDKMNSDDLFLSLFCLQYYAMVSRHEHLLPKKAEIMRASAAAPPEMGTITFQIEIQRVLQSKLTAAMKYPFKYGE